LMSKEKKKKKGKYSLRREGMTLNQNIYRRGGLGKRRKAAWRPNHGGRKKKGKRKSLCEERGKKNGNCLTPKNVMPAQKKNVVSCEGREGEKKKKGRGNLVRVP